MKAGAFRGARSGRGSPPAARCWEHSWDPGECSKPSRCRNSMPKHRRCAVQRRPNPDVLLVCRWGTLWHTDIPRKARPRQNILSCQCVEIRSGARRGRARKRPRESASESIHVQTPGLTLEEVRLDGRATHRIATIARASHRAGTCRATSVGRTDGSARSLHLAARPTPNWRVTGDGKLWATGNTLRSQGNSDLSTWVSKVGRAGEWSSTDGSIMPRRVSH